MDAAPLEAGLIDEATFVAQGITGTWQTVDALRFIVEDLGVQPDLLLLGTSFPDAVSRQFLGFSPRPMPAAPSRHPLPKAGMARELSPSTPTRWKGSFVTAT